MSDNEKSKPDHAVVDEHLIQSDALFLNQKRDLRPSEPRPEPTHKQILERVRANPQYRRLLDETSDSDHLIFPSGKGGKGPGR